MTTGTSTTYAAAFQMLARASRCTLRRTRRGTRSSLLQRVAWGFRGRRSRVYSAGSGNSMSSSGGASEELLFVNGSTNAGEFRDLAQAVGGEDVDLINGDQVFRSFDGVTRLRLNGVGLTAQLGRNISFTNRMGADVAPALVDAQRRQTRKSVLSGSGYEDGERRDGRRFSKRTHLVSPERQGRSTGGLV